MNIELIISFVGLLFSILFSSSEIALISANNLQLKVWEKQKLRGASLAIKITNNKEEYLSTILIGTTLSNILITTYATIYLSTDFNYSPLLIIIIISSLVLLLGEIIPKAISRELSNKMILINAPILYLFNFIFRPINRFFSKFNNSNISISNTEKHSHLKDNRDDLHYLYKQVDDPNTMENDQKEMISQVFEFSKSTIEDAMTPRIDISAINVNSNLEEIMHIFIDSGHSKIPVYKNNIDNIIGIIYLYDLFKSPEDINDVIKDIKFFPYTKSVMDTLKEFQDTRHSIAIVLDEHGGTSGLVTTEDLFEELFGEFSDEFDNKDSKYKKLADGSILADAKIEIDHFNKEFKSFFPEGEYETIAGYIISNLGRIPNKGEHLFLPIGQFLIRKGSSRKIEQVQIFFEK
tara:strand:- start:322 stop:1539 length:1218 start_codon:yes stop_codon:yes gene_type:complete